MRKWFSLCAGGCSIHHPAGTFVNKSFSSCFRDFHQKVAVITPSPFRSIPSWKFPDFQGPSFCGRVYRFPTCSSLHWPFGLCWWIPSLQLCRLHSHAVSSEASVTHIAAARSTRWPTERRGRLCIAVQRTVNDKKVQCGWLHKCMYNLSLIHCPPPKKERERESFHRAVNGVFLFSTVLLLLIKYFCFFWLKTKYFQMLKLIKMK